MNAIRQAFARSVGIKTPADLAVLVVGALTRKPRLTRDQQRGWSTNISFRTYNALKNQGVLA